MNDFKLTRGQGLMLLAVVAAVAGMAIYNRRKMAGALASARSSDSALMHSAAGYGAGSSIDSAATQTTLTKPAAVQGAGSQTLAG
jgi:hypothetical protein